MAILEALKVIADVVVEAVKENPVAAVAIGGTVLVGGGALVYYKKRKTPVKKLADITVSEEALAAAVVAHTKATQQAAVAETAN